MGKFNYKAIDTVGKQLLSVPLLALTLMFSSLFAPPVTAGTGGICLSGSAFVYEGVGASICFVRSDRDGKAVLVSTEAGSGFGGGLSPTFFYSNTNQIEALAGPYAKVQVGPYSQAKSLEMYCDGTLVDDYELAGPKLEAVGAVGATWILGHWDPSSFDPCDKHYPTLFRIPDAGITDHWFSPAYWAKKHGVIWFDHTIINGQSYPLFVPSRLMNRQETVYALWVAEGRPWTSTAGDSPFSDVPKYIDQKLNPYLRPIRWAARKGITLGYGDGRFGPNDAVSRGQMITFIHRAAGSPLPERYTNWNDITNGEYWYVPMQWAAQQHYPKIIRGDGRGNLMPSRPLMRSDGMTIIYRYHRYINTIRLSGFGN